MQVPLLDLRRQYRTIKDEIDTAIAEVVETQYFRLGPKVKEFEERTAEYCQTAHAVGVASGTDALLLALMVEDVGPGDEVITTPYTFFSTAGVIWRLGARPVFVDIDPATCNIDPSRIEAAVTERTRAVMPVHLYGQCVEMEPILEISKRRGLAVVEDAAQAIGAEERGRRAGSLGDLGCFSFFPSKNLGGYGDGGLVTTADEVVAGRLTRLREHGECGQYLHDEVGLNSRLDAIQAAVLLVKLRHLDGWSDGRARNAAYYNERFEGSDVVAPYARPDSRHIYNQYVVRVPRRDELLAHLREQGIGCALYYPVPLHLQKCFESLGYGEGDFPESERASRETIAIPVFSLLTEEERDHVATTILAFYGGGGN